MNFEKKMEELQKIVEKLDNKEVTLEQGISLYEEGLNLTKECLAGLSESKGKIIQIKKEMDKLIEEPFTED